MENNAQNEPATSNLSNHTGLERVSDRELLVTRTFDHPARLVFEAWTTPALFVRWWVPRSFGIELLSYEMDFRVGGRYRLVFKAGPGEMAFFGTYREVTPHTRLSWTNEEAGDSGQLTTVTFEEAGGKTRLTVRESYPTKRALDDAVASGSTGGMEETLEQLRALLANAGA